MKILFKGIDKFIEFDEELETDMFREEFVSLSIYNLLEKKHSTFFSISKKNCLQTHRYTIYSPEN